ncbi:MAG: tyrosine--tRNA ligase [Candidatus Diapherotrites archaeon]|nr:tyrosine--tRNA ligase [Candidatus Diapherotrites archaeon]
MNLQERLELIQRNTAEIITLPEMRALLERKKKPRVYCGYEPSGPMHVGHFVTCTKLLDLEKAGFETVVLLADWHAWLNKKGSWEDIWNTAKTYEKAMKGLGLKNTEFVLGTSFERKAEYMDDVLTLALNTTLNRGLRSMQEVARDIENATVSQAVYPLMQIADMKHLKLDAAEAGLEQRKIHMLGRESFHHIDYQKVAYVHTPLITALTGPGNKMSSSKPETMISVLDGEEEIMKKLNKAYCPEGISIENPVLQLCQLLVFPHQETLNVKRSAKFGGDKTFHSYAEVEQAFVKKELHPADLKNAVALALSQILEPARKAFK